MKDELKRVSHGLVGFMESESTEYVERDTVGFVKMMEDEARVARNEIDEDIAEMEGWLQSMAEACDQNMSDVTAADVASPVATVEDKTITVLDGGTRFGVLDREILAILTASGGSNGSSKNASWSRRRFDEWRLQNGMPTSVPIETMDIKDLAALLPTFFRQVMKHSGDRYPLESLHGFFRGFTRIMQKAQEARECETRVKEEPFCMMSNPLFRETGVAFLEAMRRSVLAGANKGRKNAVVISWEDEQAMLAGRDHQASHPYGCFRRWAYYCISRFAIRSGKELYNVMDFDFQERVDKDGACVIYGERLLKNLETSVVSTAVSVTPVKGTKRPKVEPLRIAVQCHEQDVIYTYRQFMKHQPVKVDDEIGKPRHLFLQPIGNPVTNAWFAKAHVSERVLISMFKTMSVIAGINVKDSNKVGRPTSTSTSIGEVSAVICSRSSVTPGICGNGVYSRYVGDRDAEVRVLQLCDTKTSDATFNKRKFQDAFKEEHGTHQNMSDASLGKVLQLPDPDIPSPAACDVIFDSAAEGVLNSDGQLSDNLDTESRDKDVLLKLQVAHSQFKDLGLTLFGSLTRPGENFRDLVQVAMLQLQGLESTLSSMMSIS